MNRKEIPVKPVSKIQYEIGQEKPGCVQLVIFALVFVILTVMCLL